MRQTTLVNRRTEDQSIKTTLLVDFNQDIVISIVVVGGVEVKVKVGVEVEVRVATIAADT